LVAKGGRKSEKERVEEEGGREEAGGRRGAREEGGGTIYVSVSVSIHERECEREMEREGGGGREREERERTEREREGEGEGVRREKRKGTERWMNGRGRPGVGGFALDHFAVTSATAQIFARDMRRRICPILQCVVRTASAATFFARARQGLTGLTRSRALFADTLCLARERRARAYSQSPNLRPP
jgi:hypothetical protein